NALHLLAPVNLQKRWHARIQYKEERKIQHQRFKKQRHYERLAATSQLFLILQTFPVDQADPW
ncbi:hypothetical protein BGZ46_005658, partial [Entomortierella lignicola]